jgi:hypothetical protein
MATLRISMSDVGSTELSRLHDVLSEGKRTGLHEAIGVELRELTAEHVRHINSHKTAQALGATPTNHLAKAAEKIAEEKSTVADTTGVTLTINHPGFGRALHDVTIRPTTSKALAIPIDAISYGVRAAQLWDSLKLFIPKGHAIIAMRTEDGKIKPLYLLRSSVTQKQDRSLLPNDEEFRGAGARGALTFLKRELGNN